MPSLCNLLGHALWIFLEGCSFVRETEEELIWERQKVGGGAGRGGGSGNCGWNVMCERRIKVKRQNKKKHVFVTPAEIKLIS